MIILAVFPPAAKSFFVARGRSIKARPKPEAVTQERATDGKDRRRERPIESILPEKIGGDSEQQHR